MTAAPDPPPVDDLGHRSGVSPRWYRPCTTAATVFVDDAVLGRLPDVCVKTGAPADGTLTLSREIGGGSRLGVLWLLVLAGPLGWLVLFALSDRGEVLTIRVPLSDRAHREQRSARRREMLALVTLAVVVACLAGLVIVPVSGPVGSVAVTRVFAPGLVALAAVVGVAAWRARRARLRWSVAFTLDASRRWVTIDGLHEDFAARIDARQQASRPVASPMPDM